MEGELAAHIGHQTGRQRTGKTPHARSGKRLTKPSELEATCLTSRANRKIFPDLIGRNRTKTHELGDPGDQGQERQANRHEEGRNILGFWQASQGPPGIQNDSSIVKAPRNKNNRKGVSSLPKFSRTDELSNFNPSLPATGRRRRRWHACGSNPGGLLRIWRIGGIPNRSILS